MISPVELRVGGSREATFNLRPTVDFLRRTIESGYPANSIVVLESRSSLTTGAIFYGKERGQPRYATLPQVVNSFLGSEILLAMADGKTLACQASRPEKEHFFQEGTVSRGGWRGLILVAEGPTIRIPQRKDEAVKLVDR